MLYIVADRNMIENKSALNFFSEDGRRKGSFKTIMVLIIVFLSFFYCYLAKNY